MVTKFFGMLNTKIMWTREVYALIEPACRILRIMN